MFTRTGKCIKSAMATTLLLATTTTLASKPADPPGADNDVLTAESPAHERTPAPTINRKTEQARAMLELEGQARPANPSTWNEPSGSLAVSVGPDTDCDYSNLQDAIDDGAAGQHSHIGLHVDYEFSEGYVLQEPHEWPGSPWILGGFPDCDVSDPDPDHSSQTVLDADGQDRVFRIDSTAGEDEPFRWVRLDRLVLTNGSTSSDGGGIRISGRLGRLSVELMNVDVENNNANGWGGGIWITTAGDSIFDGDELPPLVFLDDDSWVTGNEANESGGGIRCLSNDSNIGGVNLRTGSGPIVDNEAEYGGGVAISGCMAVLRNGEPFLTLIPASGIAANTAHESGGGLYAENGATVSVSSRYQDEYGGHPENAATILFNEAKRGGGIFATDPDTSVFMFRSAVIANQAVEVDDDGGYGGGIYAIDEASVTYLALDGEGACRPTFTENFVTTVGPCNRLENNSADASGGGAFVHQGASLLLEKGMLRGNSANNNGSAIMTRNTEGFGDDPVALATVISTLVHGNEGAERVFYASEGSHIDTRWSTIVDNPYPGGGSLFRAFAPEGRSARIDLRSSIVWDDDATSGLITRGGEGNTTAFGDCLIGFQDPTPVQFTTIGYYSHIDPEFRDPENDNFRLSDTSPAINYCDDFSDPPERDLDDRIREFEHAGPITEPPEPVPGGIFDLGAYTALLDELFHDRFEQD